MNFGLHLPQIVVVGGQSVGKSSVLESVVGRDFLPRGTGIVTRCPLILKCKHSRDQDYAEFLHRPGTHYQDYSLVREEIERRTSKLAGNNKGIIEDPISLTICSRNVLDFTLVDLPGITRVAVGDQSPDIEAQTTDLVMKYVREPNSIILAVSPANNDIQNSDAMKVVRGVDREGQRTIGVLTKLDIMDRGTSAVEILDNKVFPLKLGYVGVVNRSQADLNDNKAVDKARADEVKFFREHEDYKHRIERLGTRHLQTVLNRELRNHIERTLPQIRAQLAEKRHQADARLKEYDRDDKPDNSLTRLIDQYSQKVYRDLEGLSGNVQITEKGAGANINDLFLEKFPDILSLDKIQKFDKQIIKATVSNMHGHRIGIYTPDMAFHTLATLLIENYKEPVTECVDVVGEVLLRLTHEAGEVLANHPKLQQQVNIIVDSFIQEQQRQAKTHLRMHIDAQKAYRNTNHHDFVRMRQEHNQSNREGNQTSNGDWNKMQEEEIERMLDWYMDVVARTVLDTVPKYIVLILLDSLIDFVRVDLSISIRHEYDVDDLMQRDQEKQRIIDRLKKEYATSDDALRIIDDFYKNRTAEVAH